jgi:hypothetical protein
MGMPQSMLTLRKLPVWAVGIIEGIYFGVIMGFFDGSQDHDWKAAAASGLFAGVFFGVAMGFTIDRQRDKIRDIAQPVPNEKFEAAYRASLKGPIPKDPEIYAASVRLLRYRLQRIQRTRRWNAPIFGLFILLGVYLVITSGAVWWLAVAVFTLMVPLTYWRARQTRLRCEVLRIAA